MAIKKSVTDAPHFRDEHAAIARLESILWPNGPVCPHCGNTEKVYAIKGKTARPGLKTCGACRKQFTVKVGTLFEDSHVPMHKWWQAVHLLCSSKKGISSHQLHRTLNVTYKTAWFMSHRIREAMRTDALSPPAPTSGSTYVEVDETYIGRKKGTAVRRGHGHKLTVLTLVERGGEARSFHVENAAYRTIFSILANNIEREAKVVTDEGGQYATMKADFPHHETVNHKAEEWRRGDAHTNTVENFFSIFKRGMKGIYQHCSEKHLHRYIAEYDFRYSNRAGLGVHDEARAERAMQGITGRRLTYRAADRRRAPTG
jgi:transposase-like protein